METNEKIEQKRIVLDTPGERREVITETSRAGPSEFKLSPGTIGVIAVLAIIVIGVVIYIVSNKNANEAANREAASQTSREQVSPPIVQQQPSAPIIIQQPIPAQQAPVIIQQPALPSAATTIDDATMNEVATKRLADDPGMDSVSVTIRDGRAVLTGTVNSAAIKVSAEQLVRDVRGVRLVENRIILSLQ